MRRSEQIYDCAGPGDIVLTRNKLDPLRAYTGDRIAGFWRDAYFCIGGGKVIYVQNGKVGIQELFECFSDDRHVGLFRSKDGLTKKEQRKVVRAARKMMGIRYNLVRLFWRCLGKLFKKKGDPDLGTWNKTTLTGSEFVAKIYSRLNMSFGPTPVDFDHSQLTVRIM